MNMTQYYTIESSVELTGIGLHTGAPVSIILHPAHPSKKGLFFIPKHKPQLKIPALAEYVSSTFLSTCLSHDSITIMTVEHLLSACYGLNIWDLEIVFDGPEIPILDGSAKPFVNAILEAGLVESPHLHTPLYIIDPFEKHFSDGSGYTLTPDHHLNIDYHIVFDSEAIGHQYLSYRHSPTTYQSHIHYARTFCLTKDIPLLREKKLIKGGSEDNALIYDAYSLLNPDPSLPPDNCVRHKILDLLGDLMLLGQPLVGAVKVSKGGHKIHLDLINNLINNNKEHDQVISQRHTLNDHSKQRVQ